MRRLVAISRLTRHAADGAGGRIRAAVWLCMAISLAAADQESGRRPAQVDPVAVSPGKELHLERTRLLS